MRRFSMRKRVPSRGIFIILLVKADALRAGHQTEDGSWPENRKSCANVFICMLHVVALSIFVYTTKRLFLSLFFFLFCEFKLLRVQPCWFTLYQWGAEKINGFWWHDVFDLKRKKINSTYQSCFFLHWNADWQAWNSSAYGLVFATFRVWLLEKLSGKQKLCP